MLCSMMKITSIDFETANPSRASICAAGLTVLEDGILEPRRFCQQNET